VIWKAPNQTLQLQDAQSGEDPRAGKACADDQFVDAGGTIAEMAQ
jgi:hypothetical protein